MDHFQRRNRGFDTLVEFIIAATVNRLLDIKYRQNLHHHGSAKFVHDLAQTAHALFADHFEVQRIALNDDPKTYNRVNLSGDILCKQVED